MSIGVEDLKIYQMARKLEVYVFKMTKEFPQEEKYRLVDNLRRSSASVTANIAEAYGKYHFRTKINAMYISRGEAEETKSHIRSALQREYIVEKICQEYLESYTELIKGINGYIKFLKRKAGIISS